MTPRADDDGTVVVPRSGGGLLAVHAHPDDETLATGALLATWAAAGLPVTVVTCTRGERGEVIGEHLAHLAGDGPALAAHRTGELARALAALGASGPLLLDEVPDPAGRPGEPAVRYADSGMAWLAAGRAGAADDLPPGAFVAVRVDVAAARLAGLLRERRPDVVVGYEPGGGYGHPDHVHAHRVLMRAVELAAAPDGDAAPWTVPVVLWSVLDADALRAGYATARRVVAAGGAAGADGMGLGAPDPTGPLPSAAVPGSRIGVRVPLAPVLHAVRAALGAHASQVQAVRAGTDEVPLLLALSNRVLLPVLAEETYEVVRTSPVRWPAAVRVA